MDVHIGQSVRTMNAVTIQVDFHFIHIEPGTIGDVIEVEGSYPPRAHVRFKVNGEEPKEWINSDELLPA